MALFSFVLLVALGQSVHGACVREFFAQPVIYDKAMDIDFYYTGINLQSVRACAEFCGDRHFCRTAVYNSYAKTCAISYEYTLNCRYNTNRLSEFDVSRSSSHLIQVACVTKCNQDEVKTLARKPVKLLTGEPTEPVSRVPATLKKVELVTGEPNDGFPQDPNSARIFRDHSHARDEPKSPEFVNKLVIENITSILPVHDQFISRFMKSGSQTCYRQIKHRFLLGSSFERHNGKTLNECRCLCAATYNSTNKSLCQSFQWYKNGACVLNKGNHHGKYDLIKDSKATYQYVDCDVQVLLDVASKACGKGKKKLSSKKKHSKGTEHSLPSRRTTVAERSTVISTTVATAPAFVTDTPESEEMTSTKSAETTEDKQDVDDSNTSTSASEEKNKEKQEEVERKDSENENSKETEKKSGEEHNTVSTTEETPSAFVTESAVSSTATSTEKSAFVTESTEEKEEDNLPIELHGCFEHIAGYMMISVAGGLAHRVTLDECQCLCANSRESGRYSFDCASATYYHNERDCILNLEDRHQQPRYFEKQLADFNVTYVGMTCDRNRAIASVINPALEYGCKASRTTTTVAPTKAPRSRSRGVNSDKCFLELPLFVLEGVAQQVESGITADQCKCMCAQAEEKYGERCQSFQYYYDSQTCLLNKQNRFSNPEKFNFVPSDQARSYFEFRCGIKGDKLSEYLSQSCLVDNSVLRNELNTEANTVQVESGNGNNVESTQPRQEEGEEQKIENGWVEVSTHPYHQKSSEEEEEKEEIVGTKPISSESPEANQNSESPEATTLEEDGSKTSTTTESPDSDEEVTVSGEVTTPEYPSSTEHSEEDQKSSNEVQSSKEEEISKELEAEGQNSSEQHREDNTSAELSTETPTTQDTTETPKTTITRKIRKKVYINHSIPEAEGLNEKDFEEDIEMELSAELDSPTVQTTKQYSQSPQLDPIQNLATPSPRRKGFAHYHKKVHGVKTRKFSEKLDKPELTTEETTTTEEPTTTEQTTTSTIAPTTTTTIGYPSAGKCTYSALYQTAFSGRKLLKTVFVKTPTDCFGACFALRCRSANLVAQGEFMQCELFHDSLIDYRRPDMIGYDGATVYFDGIRCDGSS